jgi:T-complex protein 1 subunit theta
MASGLSGMLKDGHTSYEGVDEAIMRNIDAAKQLADIVKSSLGPNGQCPPQLACTSCSWHVRG